MLTKTLEISVLDVRLRPEIDAVCGDSGRVLRCIISDADIPSGATARFFAEKPSGKVIYNNGTIEGNAVIVPLTNQTLAEEGKVACEVEILKSGEMVTSFRFVIHVHQQLRTDEALESFNETDVLDQYVKDAKAAKDAAEKAKDGAVAAQGKAETAQKNAETARDDAKAAEEGAVSAQKAAETARDDAKAAEEGAVSAQKAAESAKTGAVNAQKAAESAKAGAESARDQAEDWSEMSKSYAIGTGGTARQGDDTDNSRYYYEQTKKVFTGLDANILLSASVEDETLVFYNSFTTQNGESSKVPIASKDQLGFVQIGENIGVTNEGLISQKDELSDTEYTELSGMI